MEAEKQKALYEKITSKNKEQYLREMEAYKHRKEEEASNLKKEEDEQMKLQKQEALQLLKKKKRTKILIKKKKEKGNKSVVDPNKAKKSASSFLLFSKEARKTLVEERQGINMSMLNALISIKWKELIKEERWMLNEKAAESMEACKKELEEYNNKFSPAEESQKQE